ncbi:MAG: alpha/beta hydrolase [Coriobacteriales bacterium]|nr:alpha/beta hydrolase [Coriobacteriales bacterium]MBQ6586574.1 alpha/beta hydrolase [Coriobacteriales bacterium]
MFFVTAEKAGAAHPSKAPIPSKDDFVQFKDVKIHYRSFNSKAPDAPFLLLLHGSENDSSVFDGLISSYTPYYNVITMDMRGCGGSERGSLEPCIELIAQDLFGLLNTLHIGNAVILGYGSGGIAALSFAKAHQERVAALILVGASLFPQGKTASARMAKDITGKFASLGKGFSRKAEATCDKVSIAKSQPTIDPASLRYLRVPTLVLTGEFDDVKLEHSQLIAKSLPNARLEVIPNAGHCIMLDEPLRFARTTVAFLLEDD